MGRLVLVCDHRESGMVKSACVQYRAFSQELPPEIYSRDGRVTALIVYGVLAPEKSVLRLQQMRVVPRKDCLSSRIMG